MSKTFQTFRGTAAATHTGRYTHILCILGKTSRVACPDTLSCQKIVSQIGRTSRYEKREINGTLNGQVLINRTIIGDKRFGSPAVPTGRVPVPATIPVFANLNVCCQINLKLLSMRHPTSRATIHS